MKQKNPAAVTLGRLGGFARAKKLSRSKQGKKKLSKIGRKGAAARWKKAGKHGRL